MGCELICHTQRQLTLVGPEEGGNLGGWRGCAYLPHPEVAFWWGLWGWVEGGGERYSYPPCPEVADW